MGVAVRRSVVSGVMRCFMRTTFKFGLIWGTRLKYGAQITRLVSYALLWLHCDGPLGPSSRADA